MSFFTPSFGMSLSLPSVTSAVHCTPPRPTDSGCSVTWSTQDPSLWTASRLLRRRRPRRKSDPTTGPSGPLSHGESQRDVTSASIFLTTRARFPFFLHL
ncbi:uncharacterized protein SCHCODRAFT_02636991 [Schizophyllum commune H4-8]|uniref:uncharacterized protein n=1 Tax=Schizophyllum commune (strain H4-8 / FGSC 9210) TaxID=578458 RepID=UPI002160FCBC|nr:uncharacterized protein SCHCODRAFT_02636991 [Schizophyllum commune H4-8]KAI5888545.1 hypothetical protein SCHCODRAFT_02636991 [Schizophyllum commune H4-8]